MERMALAHIEPIASGSIRDVYRHPDNPDLLIKVVRPSTIDQKFGSGRRWFKASTRRYGFLISYLREVREQIALHASGGDHPAFVQKIVGFAETDLGPGLVVTAEFSRDGSYAPTLGQLIQKGRFDAMVEAALERFLEQLIESDLIVADLHPGNLVYAYTPGLGDHFVMIDGLGFKTLIPLERMSRRLNMWSNRHKANLLRGRVQLARMRAASPASVKPDRKPMKDVPMAAVPATLAASLFAPEFMTLATIFL